MTMILAHRGASKERPENTMAAFRHAAELGAGGLETDVHLLYDGTLIVRHDAELGRCEAASGRIYDYEGSALRRIPVGKNHPGYENETMPVFDELLDELEGNRLFLNVELKPDGFLSELGTRTAQALEARRMWERCIVSSFDHALLLRLKREYPRLSTGILYSNPHADIVSYCKKYGFDAIHPAFRLVDEELVRRCHENGIAVNVWTVDSPGDILRMIRCGVDAVISNDVRTAVETLRSCRG